MPSIKVLGPLLIAFLLLISANVFAEAPVVVGEFTRSDGVSVKAVELESASVMRIGVMCWFDLSDGTLARPPSLNTRSCVVRLKDSTAEIYSYPSDAHPIASRVERFDGYTFVDITSPSRRWLSPLIHTGHHLLSYLVAIALFIFPLMIGRRILVATPKAGWKRFLRVFWMVFGVFITLTYSVMFSMFSAISPPVFIMLLTLAILMYWQMKKLAQCRTQR